ncbi:arylamine N-acetyltransferase family protein [Sphingomonas nostoxanthinifaciens]|uniref:arylamine N-acetyltransferase family protein n=1 Tax=Sphingomonas nostoxanthinifaciens TaxID=2872652 RepID=UPI001CC20A85|nr:arylamine N-acetyltransferase [Sphingomonas nostoxanthinifaciens]UAK26089.1 arylamine N-acetyltransferase [Sphingomonas nostoxanthinifaciens]
MFSLAAYLERIRLAEMPLQNAEGLAILQRAHRLAIPFENLDVRLGRPIALDSDAVFAKLVTARRGGYCFEHNRLFLDALDAFGFAARPLMARVWLGLEHTPPLTHTLALVTIDGQDWIADPGFGGSYSPPMPLVDGEEADAPDGARFRLGRDPVYGWMLERVGDPATTDGRATGSGWQRQYSFDLAPAYPTDAVLSNFWVSTAPDSRFVQRVIVSIVLPNGFATLTDRLYRRRNGETGSEGEITDPRVYRMRLSMMFGIDLSVEEVAALGLFDLA